MTLRLARRLQLRVGLGATRANARLQRKLGDAGVYSFLLDPASRSGITRRLQSASQGSRPTHYRNGFCLLLPGDRAWLLTYEQARQRGVAALGGYVQKRPKFRYYCSRWPVADVANKLPWTCWCDLVDWALAPQQDRQRDDPDGPWGWRGLLFIVRPAVSNYGPKSSCRQSAREHGACYCGKVRTRVEEEAARRGESWLQPGGVVVED